MPAESASPILEVRGLKKHFGGRRTLFGGRTGLVKAVDGIDLDLFEGETLAIVGESGSGKTTLARLLVGLEAPTAGQGKMGAEDMFAPDWQVSRHIQMVFQDPYSSLNPRMTVGQIISEAWDIHPDIIARASRKARLAELLEQVGLRPLYADRHPHALSGGQRQRVGIARALAVSPPVIICDEPVSALDVSVQAQVINLLRRLQRELKLSYVFISHDMAVVRALADRIAVMYLGRIVETGTRRDIYERPAHPYTRSLLSAVPVADPERRNLKDRIALTGEIPSPMNMPSGCRFRTRCWKAQSICAEVDPALTPVGSGTQSAACHFPETDAPAADAAKQGADA